MKKTILICDDEKEMRNLIKVCLNGHYDTKEAGDGEECLQVLEENTIHLLLLDIMMPEKNGFDVIKEMKKREKFKDIPIITLTALGESDDIVKGLNLGADDYIVKPFEPSVLLARINSVLRRVDKLEENLVVHGLNINVEKMQITYNGKVLPLTKKEFHLFTRLAMNPGRVYSREQLVELEWDIAFSGDTRNIDAHIKNIREKLKKIGYEKQIIETVWGIGYQFVE